MPQLDPDRPLPPPPEVLPVPKGRPEKDDSARINRQTVVDTPDLNAVIPISGETVRSWLLRRLKIVETAHPNASIVDHLSMVSLPINDVQLMGIAKVNNITKRPGGGGLPLGFVAAPGGEGTFGAFKKIGSALGAVAQGIGAASEAAVNVGEAAVRKVGEAFDDGMRANIEAIPEDIRSGLKQVVAEGAQIFGGSIGTVEKGLRPVLGPVAQSAGYVAGKVAAEVQNIAAYIDPTGAISHKQDPKFKLLPTPKEMWKSATSQTVGDQFSTGYGLVQGTTEEKIVSNMVNFMVDWAVYGAPGKVFKGLEIASTLPAAAKFKTLVDPVTGLSRVVGPGESVGLKGLKKWAYELSAKPVDQLVRETKVGTSMVDDLYLRSRDANTNRLLDVFPQLNPEVAGEIVAAGTREEVEDVVIAAMSGRLMPKSRSELMARLDDIEAEAKTLMGTDEAGQLSLFTETGSGANKLRRGSALMKEHDQIINQLSRNKGKTVIRELPHSTTKTQLIDLAKHSRKVPGEKRSAFNWVASAYDKNWTRRYWSKLPHWGMPVAEKTSGRAQIVQWGELLKYSRAEIDDFANRYLATTSKGEVNDLFKEILAGAEHKLPPGIARETLQMVDNPLGFEYAVDEVGESVGWVLRVKGSPDRKAKAFPQPLYSSQLTDVLPTPDPRAVLESMALRKRAQDFFLQAGKRGGGKGKAAQGARAGLIDPYIRSQAALSTFTTFLWKPMVLSRIGWPVKVVALDEQARLAAYDIPSLWHRPWEHLTNVRQAAKDLAAGQTPDEVLMNAGRDLVQRKSSNRLLTHGNKGYGASLQGELTLMHKADEVAYMAKHGKEATKRWLDESVRGQQILHDYRPVLNKMGKSVDEWLDTINDQIRVKGRTPALKDAIATGKFKVGDEVYSLTDNATSDYFQHGIGADEAPEVVRDIGDVWARWDQKQVRQFTNFMMRNLGSKPTNVLSRSPAFSHFYQKELNYLVSRGIDKRLAQTAAKEHAIKSTNDLLYNLLSKTQFDEAHANLFPFFPAWKEVLKTWSVNVPNAIGGPVIGQLTLAARLKVLGDFGQEMGLLKKDQHGEWIIDLGFYKTPLSRLAMFGTLPGIGPGHASALSFLSKKSAKIEKLLQPIQQYGPETTIFPQWINRLWIGGFGPLAGGKPPPWEVTSYDFQQDQFDLTVLRQMQLRADQIRKIAAMPEGDEKRAAGQQLIADAQQSAKSEYVVRAATGFFLPAAPLRFNESEEKMDEFRNSLEGLSTGERRNAYEDFLSENPNLEFMLVSRSYKVKDAKKIEDGRDAYWRARRAKDIEIYSPREFSNILIGFAEYDRARSLANEKKAKAGVNARDRLLNYFEVGEANLEKLIAIDNLEKSNPDWAWSFARLVGSNEKIIDVAEDREIEAWKALRIIRHELQGQETDLDWKALRTVTAQLGDRVRDYIEFTKSGDMVPGIERTVAKYFEDVFNPFMDKLDSIYSKLDDAKTSEETSAIMDEVRRFRNSQTESSVDGETLPRPEEVLYQMKSPEDRQVTTQGWAMTKVEWLTNFQREKVGLPNTEISNDYWDKVNEERLNLKTWAAQNQVSTSSKAYRDRKEALDAWERQTAVENGLGTEWQLAQALPFQRLAYFNLVPTDNAVWQKVLRTSSEVQRQMQARDLRSFSNTAGRYYASIFLPWLDMVRTVDETFADDLNKLRSVAPKTVQQGPWYNFYTYLFLTGKTFGV